MNRRTILLTAAIIALVASALFLLQRSSRTPGNSTSNAAAQTSRETKSLRANSPAPSPTPASRTPRDAAPVRPTIVAQPRSSDPVLGQFQDWYARYLAASPSERAALENEGVELATMRRATFKQLIKSDPREALKQAVPVAVRQQLPASVVEQLEERLNGVAALRVIQGAPAEGEPRPVRSLTFREAEFKDGKTYRAYVYGRREEKVTWTAGALLNGVALEADFAVNEDPLRRLEVGEVPTTTKPAVTLCPVSGNQTAGGDLQPGEAISDQTPAVETATEIVYFCGGVHINHYTQTLIMGEGVSGGAFGFTGILPAAPTPALGIVKVLAIPMTYADQNAVPSTEAALYATFRDVGDFYSKASFGRLTLVGVVTPPVKLKHNEAWYVNRDTSNGGDISGTGVEHQEARDEARKLGFDSNDYDCVVVRHNGGPGSYGGLGGGSSVWVRGDGMSLWAHEIGHCFALAHANFWDTAGTSSIGAGANQEYGDSYDIMGGAGTSAGHYNAQAKNQIKWMPSNFVQNVTQSGQYRIYAMDQGVLDPARRYAMTVVKDAQRTYWGEVRSLFDSNPWVKNGMLLGWRYPNGSGNNIQLIDTTPGSPFAKEDAPISLGNTFSDFESGIHMTTIATNDSPRYMDVVVNFGQFPTNQRPSLSMTASADVVPVGATVTFTAVASDPEGDSLAYAWQHFGDSNVKIVSPNSPVITRTFSSAGTYVVTCTVSDMKGGTTTRNQLITVGNGNNRFTVGGRITLLGQGLSDVAVTANGANGVITDADGYYTIPNLTANTYTMTPLLYGYSFGELFNNSVTVAPNFTGADFEATAQPVLTITATLSNANELAPVTAGRFTITRTGDITQDLLVNVNSALGSATKGTDYNFAPDYVAGSQGFSTFTILAGNASLDVTVTPIVDTAQEGPETVILQLGPGNGYLVGPQSSATVVIDDDDTTLPKISIAATTPDTMENSGASAVLTFTRTGATTSNLTVNYSVSGTATSGTDFVALGSNVVILAGSSSAVVNVTPVNDSVSEPLETVRLTTLASAAYIIDPLASNATVNLIDDDVQTVTVVATDPSAREVDLSQPGAVADTGTFLITRSGDLSSPLTVYYATAGTPNSGVAALHGVDYDALPGVLVIPAGASNASVTIVPRYDGFGEGPESVVFLLGAGSTSYVLGSPSSATVTINDSTNDVPYVDVVNTASAAEPSTAGNFRITARGGTNAGVLTVFYTISGTATAGVDYTIAGLDTNTLTGSNTITLAGGATVTANITVTPINDALLEDLETITLTITSNTTYQTYAPTASATMWLRDNDGPTVYVDTQVGTGGSVTVTEGTVSNPTKFYVSRTGATTDSLEVNFTLDGTALAGTDYNLTTNGTLTFTNANSTGTLTIPAGSLGADVSLTVADDALVEGTETIQFNFAPGVYSRGPGTTMYVADNDAATNTVSFVLPSSSGSESLTNVSIPVMLSATSAVPVTVEYAVSASTSSGTATTVAAQSLPYWVRLVRSGPTMTFFESTDGVAWLQRGGPTNVANLPTNVFYAGLVVASGSAATNVATIDNFSLTGLSAGATTGAVRSANLGNAAGGTNVVSGGVYSFTNAGSGVLSANTSDNCRFMYVPVTNASNCTVTARLVSLGTNAANARVGVMFRADTNNQGAIYAATMANGAGGFIAANRATLNGISSTQTPVTTQILPRWFKLERTNDLFRTFTSIDGTNWSTLGNTNQNIALGPTVLAGLAVSAKSDGSIATASFDNVSLTPAPVGALLGREVGFVNVDGSESLATNGVWTVNGSGNGIGGNNDEGRFVATELSGNFTLIARITSLAGGAANAQAGVMMRQERTHYSRQMYAGFINTGSIEQQFRAQSATTAFGTGVDYVLPPGTLTFAPGETNKNITFTVVDDSVREPNNLITIQLLNANGAGVSATANLHGYTIVDDEMAATNAMVGFAAASSSISESNGTATIFVSLSSPATAPVSVDYAVTGGSATNGGVDFDLPAGTLNFAVGESVKAIAVTIINDSSIETNETLVVTLSNPTNAAFASLTNHTLTILDDDLPVVTIVANDPNASEAGLDPGQFTLSRTGPTNNSLLISLTRTGTATSGTDYTNIATSFTILAGASNGTINVLPIQDTGNEGNETVILTIAANAAYTVGSPGTATVTIADDDRSTVTIVANLPNASETPGNPGQFTVTRTVPTNGTLTVNLSISGTAANGVDYSTVASTVSFAAGELVKFINILPIDDSITEGPEQVTISLASGSYDIGSASYDNVTIADNDNPPVLFISSPSAQGPLIASNNGVIVTATVTDDGTPQPVTLQWSQAGGPGLATFESPTNAASAVTFSTNGTYVLRVTATDGQFTVSDQVTVVVGPTITAADWVSEDLLPSSTARGQGLVQNGVFTVVGTGTGYAGTTADIGQVLVRQVDGDCTLVTRLTSLSNSAAPLAGLTLRSSLQRGASRVVLGYVPGVGLQFRTRTNINTADLTITNAGVTLPVWLKLDRNAATNQVTASFAPDVAGAPGAWTVIDSPVITNLGARVNLGFTATANANVGTTTAIFDNVALTPAPSGPALIAEELSLTPTQAGSFAETNGVYTIAGSSSGIFYGWQFNGDVMITVKHANATSGAGSATSGIRIRESMDNNGAYVQVGRIPTGSYNGYFWRSIASGGTGGVPSFTGATRWIRIIRRGNSVTAYHAPDVSGTPGTWAQIGQPQTVITTTPVIMGFNVDNASGVGLNTVTFSNLTIVPLNKAPVVDSGVVAASVIGSTPLNGTVTDDNFPAPPDLTKLWSSVSGPAPVVFGNPTNAVTTATFSGDGVYRLRLSASDSSVETFEDLNFNAFTSPFGAWQWTNFVGGSSNALAGANADPEGDGRKNLSEYGLGSNPNAYDPASISIFPVNIGTNQFYRVIVNRNPAATDLTWFAECTSTITNATSWSGASFVTETNTPANLTVRDTIPISSLPTRVYRVRVTKP